MIKFWDRLNRRVGVGIDPTRRQTCHGWNDLVSSGRISFYSHSFQRQVSRPQPCIQLQLCRSRWCEHMLRSLYDLTMFMFLVSDIREMGVLRSSVSLEAEINEMREALLRGGGGVRIGSRKGDPEGVRWRADGEAGGSAGRTVCVTGGISFVGFAIINRLLDRGYTVRLALDTQGSALPPLSPLFLDS